MTLDYAHIQKLPSPLTLDDVRTILRVSKRKAVWMLKNGYIKYETTGKRTRQYIIKAEDLIEYFDKVANNDVSICIPVGIFTSRGKNIRRGRRIIAPVIIHQKPPSTLKLWLETEWKNYGDLLTVSDIADITGYALKTIKRWIDRHKLKCFLIHRKRYIIAAAAMTCALGGVSLLAHVYTLNNIKSKTVGDGQHGSARWATKSEIKRVYRHIPFTPNKWRAQAKNGEKPTYTGGKRKKTREEELPQGIIVGCKGRKKNTTAMVDTGDVHALMIGAAGVGKTAYWLYPCIEYACASGMSFLSTDTKGDVMRNYGGVAKEYGYNVSVIDLRNPTKSNGNNLLNLVNKYMDLYKEYPSQLAYKAKAEKYAKIISKTIILSGAESASFWQNAYFYDAAEGILTATILLVAEFCEPQKRHIVSVFKIIQELLAPSEKRNKNQFQELMALLPNDHKAKWFAGAALNASDQSMASVMSTALSRLNAFLDSELEQILCFDTEIDAEKFCSEKSAIFIIMPEEAPTTFFMISLIIQQLYREILAVADEEGGKLKNRCIFFCDEFGTLPKIQDAEMIFSASRSRRLQIVPIIQSFSQLDKNYGKEGEEIIVDNTQLTIFGGFAPNSPSAEVLSKALGTRTVLTGSVNKGKNDPSESLQMTERPLMSADELKAMPKGQFVVMKTGAHPMKVRLKLFFDWGISFGEPYTVKENANRKVEYAEKKELIEKIVEKYCPDLKDETEEKSKTRGGVGGQTQVESRRHFANDLRTNRPFLRTSSIKRQYPLPPTQEETDEMDEAEQKDNEPT